MENLVTAALDLDESCLDLKLEENELMQQLEEAIQSLHEKEFLIKGMSEILEKLQCSLLNGTSNLLDLDVNYNSHVATLKRDLLQNMTDCEYLKDLKAQRLELRGVSGNANDDIQLVSQKETFKCPITQVLLVDPVKSTKCGHVYSKKAILDLMGRNKSTECPKAACPFIITEADLKVDNKIVRLVASEKRRLNLEQEHEKTTYMSI